MSADGLLPSDLIRGREIPTALLTDLPKADLHVHLDGSLRFPTYVELCKQAGRSLPGGSEEAAREMLLSSEPTRSVGDYLERFEHTLGVLQSAEALSRVARELVEDCAAENVVHLEVRFCPALHLKGELTAASSVEAVLQGLAQGAESTGTSTGLLITAIRTHPPEESEELAQLALRFKGRGVVGFDLAGQEEGNPAKLHREAFYLIQNNNLNCTVHAGEEVGPESIHQALHYLGAHRISHGTRLLEDTDLMHYVADHRIPLEMCPTSNVRAGTLSDVESHPLRLYLRMGIRCTLCTNNRMFATTTLTDELRAVVDAFDLSVLELENILIAGFKSAFLPRQERVQLLRRVVPRFEELRYVHGMERTT